MYAEITIRREGGAIVSHWVIDPSVVSTHSSDDKVSDRIKSADESYILDGYTFTPVITLRQESAVG